MSELEWNDFLGQIKSMIINGKNEQN